MSRPYVRSDQDGNVVAAWDAPDGSLHVEAEASSPTGALADLGEQLGELLMQALKDEAQRPDSRQPPQPLKPARPTYGG